MDGDQLRSSAITKQCIKLSGDDLYNSQAIYAQDVDITPSVVDGKLASSNKVKFSPVVSYDWEVKRYPGQLVAVDKRQQYVAYPIQGRTGGIVRLLHRKIADRALLRGFTGVIVDLQFSFSKSDYLATVDETGCVFIHRLYMSDVGKEQRISSEEVLQIKFDSSAAEEKHVSWCKYMSDESEDEDELDYEMNLVVTVAEKAYVMNVLGIIEEHGPGPHSLDDIRNSIIELNQHKQAIVEASFSPEGSALATASKDGTVCFFSLELENPHKPSKTLFTWEPHDGQPLTMLRFLDNYERDPTADSQYWKYCVTGTADNTELKLWDCEQWSCIQTIRFVEPESSSAALNLIAQMDDSGKFLVLSDINSRVLFILTLHQDAEISTAHVSSITEFVLGAPCLSLVILSVKKKLTDDDMYSDESDDSDDEESENGVSKEPKLVIHLQAVQPKNMQDLHITFTPVATQNIVSSSMMSAGSTATNVLNDQLSDISSLGVAKEESVSESSKQLDAERKSLSPEYVKVSPLALEEVEPNVSPGSSSAKLSNTVVESPVSRSNGSTSDTRTLLTPGAFAVSPKMATPTDVSQSPKSAHSSMTHVTQDTQLTLNSLLPGKNENVFEAGTASTVSSMTLSTKSSAAERSLDKAIEDLLERRSATPTNDSSITAPSVSTEPDVITAPAQMSTPSSADTARQLEQLFKSAASVPGAPQSMELPSHITVITEDDLLSDALPVPLKHEASAQVEGELWPGPPEFKTQPGDTQASDEDNDNIESTEESDTESDEDNVSSDKVSSDGDELNVKAIENDAGEVELQSPGGNIPPDGQPTVMPQYVQARIMSQLEQVNGAVASMRQMFEDDKRARDSLQNSDQSQGDKQFQFKQVQMMITSLSNKLNEYQDSARRDQKQQIDEAFKQMKVFVASSLSSSVEKTVSSELQKNIVPCLSSMVNPIKKDLHKIMAEKLTVADQTFRDSMNKLVNNQQMVEYIGRCVANSLQSVVQQTLRDSMQQFVVPSFDKSMQAMFSQLNTSFSTGLEQYMRQVEKNVGTLESRQAQTQELLSTSCETAMDSLKQTSTDVRQQVGEAVKQEVGKHVKQVFGQMKSQFIKDMKEVIKAEIGSALTNQEALISKQLEEIRVLAATPVAAIEQESKNFQAQIDNRLAASDFEGALSKALSASDLNLVVYTMRKIIDPSLLFNDSCNIESATLLSLIQQIGVGIDEPDLELKLMFLSEAVLKLDPTDEVIQEHMKPVLLQTQDLLNEYNSVNPNSSVKPIIRAIHMSIKSVLRYAKK